MQYAKLKRSSEISVLQDTEQPTFSISIFTSSYISQNITTKSHLAFLNKEINMLREFVNICKLTNVFLMI